MFKKTIFSTFAFVAILTLAGNRHAQSIQEEQGWAARARRERNATRGDIYSWSAPWAGEAREGISGDRQRLNDVIAGYKEGASGANWTGG